MIDKVRETGAFLTHSAHQGEALKPLLRHISQQDVGEVVNLIMDAKFPLDIEADLLSSFTGGERQKSRKYWDLQKWHDYILHYGTQQFWDTITQMKSGDAILDLLFVFHCGIGLSHPSCPTYAVLSCLYLWLTQGPDAIMAMSRQQKHHELTEFKQYFVKRRSKIEPPVEYVLRLPRDPNKFAKLHPALASIYQDAPAVACPLGAEKLLAAAESFPLRRFRGQSLESQMSWAMTKASSGAMAGAMDPYKFMSGFDCGGSAAFMKMLMQNNDLMKMLTAAASSAAKQSPDIGLQICQRKSKRSKIKDMIADGPPPAILQPLPPPEHEPPPLEQWADTQKKKKKKKRVKKKKRSTVLSTAAPGPLAFENTSPSKDNDAPRASTTSVLEGLLFRKEKKKKKAKEKRAAKKLAKENQINEKQDAGTAAVQARKKKHIVDKNVKKLGCSKCRFLPKGCSACRDW